MIFVETAEFTKEAIKLFTDEELWALQVFLAKNPDSGDIIQHSGGCRKLRWAVGSQGKRGGTRVIYFHRISAKRIELLKAYKKGKKDDLTEDEKRALKRIIGKS